MYLANNHVKEVRSDTYRLEHRGRENSSNLLHTTQFFGSKGRTGTKGSFYVWKDMLISNTNWNFPLKRIKTSGFKGVA